MNAEIDIQNLIEFYRTKLSDATMELAVTQARLADLEKKYVALLEEQADSQKDKAESPRK